MSFYALPQAEKSEQEARIMVLAICALLGLRVDPRPMTWSDEFGGVWITVEKSSVDWPGASGFKWRWFDSWGGALADLKTLKPRQQ